MRPSSQRENMALNVLDHTSWDARKTDDGRVSVVDVIAHVTGYDFQYAADLYRRLLAEERVPECARLPLPPRVDSLAPARPRRTKRGGARGDALTPVATLSEMLEILRQLPGATCMPGAVEMQFKRKSRAQTEPDALYIMRYAGQGGLLKIGRAHNTEKRRRQLEQGHAFRMEIVAVFPGAGHLERLIHKKLEGFRNTEGPGTEWFEVDLSVALATIQGEL